MRLATTRTARRRARHLAVYAVTALVVLGVGLAADWQRLGDTFFDPDVFAAQFPEILTVAARNTCIFAFFGFSLGLGIGLVMALMRLSSLRPYRWFATAYIELFRGLPALVTILLIGYALPIGLDVRVPGGDYGAASLALGLVAGAYMAESIRAGIEAVPRGQVEAARSLGMTSTQAMVFVVIPQAFRIVIPPLTNELVLLVKDTSLISVLGVSSDSQELLNFARDDMVRTFNGTPIVAAGLVYLAISLPLTQLARWLERRGGRGR